MAPTRLRAYNRTHYFQIPGEPQVPDAPDSKPARHCPRVLLGPSLSRRALPPAPFPPPPAERPVGTVVFFHGCARLSTSFFPFHPTACPECIGLPEELALAKQALRRGYAVLALTAKNERSQCWSSGGSWRRNDHSQVQRRAAGGGGGRRSAAGCTPRRAHAACVCCSPRLLGAPRPA